MIEMARKTVTLHIDDASIRLLVCKGKKVITGAETTLEPGMVVHGVILEEKEQEVIDGINQLFETTGIKKGKVSVSISGVRCLSRLLVFPKLPKAMLGEAVHREAKRVLPLPPEQLYLSWQVLPFDGDKANVFLNAVPRQTFDNLFTVLNKAGLNVNFVNYKPLLLAGLVGLERGVIVDVQETEFDIVVISDSSPQPFRTVAFSSPTLSWEEKLLVIGNELDRTIKYYNATGSEKPLTYSDPIFASGDLVDEPELNKSLSQTTGHPVLPLELPVSMEYPEGFDLNRYMANISLVLRKTFKKKKDAASVVNLNAQPEIYRPKTLSLAKVLAIPGAAVLVGVIVLLAMLVIQTPGDTAAAREDLATTQQLYQQSISEKTELSADITELEGETTEVQSDLDQIATALGSLEEDTSGINSALEVAMDTITTGITVSTIRYAGDNLYITGHADSEAVLLTYLGDLNSSSSFDDITISSMVENGDIGGFDFDLVGSPEKQDAGRSAIEAVLSSLPANVSLTSVNRTNNELNVTGKSSDEDGIIAYLNSLENSGLYSNISTTEIDGDMNFSLVLTIGE